MTISQSTESRADELSSPKWSPGVFLVDAAIVVAFVVLAVITRRGPLDPPSLWLDDAWPALVTRVPWSKVLLVGLTSPGYSAILKGWTHTVGFSEYQAQQPAFFFGVLGPPAVYVAARRMQLRLFPALVAATLLLVSRNHIIYSSRVKQYTLDALLSTVLIVLALEVIHHPERAWRWAWLVGVAVVATAASSLVVPTVAGAFLSGVYAAWKKPDARRVATIATGTFGLFAFMWWAVVLRPRINPTLRSYWSAFYIRLDLSFPRDVGVALLRVARGLTFAPSGVMLAVLVVAAVLVVRTRTDLAILLLTPVGVATLLAMAHVAPLGAGRTDLNLYPALVLLVAVAVDQLEVKRPYPALIAAVLVVAAAFTYRAPPSYPAEDMRGAVRYLDERARPTDEVLVYWAGRFPFALYERRFGLTVERSQHTAEGFEVKVKRPNLFVIPDHISDRSRYASDVARLTKGQDRVWFIGSHGRLDVTAIEKDLKALGFHSTRRPGDGFHAFVTFWSRSP